MSDNLYPTYILKICRCFIFEVVDFLCWDFFFQPCMYLFHEPAWGLIFLQFLIVCETLLIEICNGYPFLPCRHENEDPRISGLNNNLNIPNCQLDSMSFFFFFFRWRDSISFNRCRWSVLWVKPIKLMDLIFCISDLLSENCRMVNPSIF